jgi:hypothetical protein
MAREWALEADGERLEERRPDLRSGLLVFFCDLRQLPCGGGDGFGSAEFRDNAELLHEAQSIPVDEAFEHFAVRKAGNAYAGDVELLVCRGDPVEFALMGTAARPASHNGFAFGNEVLDRETNVGESIAVKSHSLLLSFRSPAEVGRRTVVLNISRCDELVSYLYMTLVPNFFEQTTDIGFVLFRHGESPFWEHGLPTRFERVGLERSGIKPLASGCVNLHVEQEVGPRARE